MDKGCSGLEQIALAAGVALGRRLGLATRKIRDAQQLAGLYASTMKPVVILNLITSALSGKKSRLARALDPNAPLTARDAKHEIVVAVVGVVVVLALVFAFVLSIVWEPPL